MLKSSAHYYNLYLGLGLIVLAYLTIGTLYAVYTPDWQVPDEPAHYNYIRHLVEVGGFPELRHGDYDQTYLEELTSNGFPSYMSVASLRYEGHQPPLYYLLAVPIYYATNGSLLALRLFSLGIGAGVVILAGLAVQRLLPHSVPLALTAAGFVAFIPQHVAMMAAVNNDSLAELWVALAIFLMFHSHRFNPVGGLRIYLALGLVIGLAFLTKSTVYFIALVAGLMLVLRARRVPGQWGQLVVVFLPALLLGALWWGRNVAVYGWPDLMGLQRHESVVLGQPRTGEWLAEYGFWDVTVRFLRTTFNSFWGQFGWMGVPMDARVYQLLKFFSIVILSGLGVACWRRPAMTENQRDGLLVLFILGFLTFLQYFGYNLTFIQHQGRYLFPALLPLGFAVAVGMWGWAALISHISPRLASSVHWLPVTFVPFLAALDVFALFWFIVRTLA